MEGSFSDAYLAEEQIAAQGKQGAYINLMLLAAKRVLEGDSKNG